MYSKQLNLFYNLWSDDLFPGGFWRRGRLMNRFFRKINPISQAAVVKEWEKL